MKKSFMKIIGISAAAVMLLAMTACGGAKVPKDYDYDLSDYIKLGNYKNLTYAKSSTDVTDDQVQDYINQVLQQSQTTEDVKSGTVTKDSTVKVDYVGKVNGKKFDGGSAEDATIDIDNSSFISGFAEGLVGHNVGDKFDLNLTFPSDYSNSKLAGKPVVFTVTIKALVVTKTPEFDDAFVKKNSKFKTTDQYRANVRKNLEKNAKTQAEATEKQEVFDKIVQSTKVKKYPSKEVKAREDKFTETYKSAAKQSGTSLNKYLKQNMGMTSSEFKAQAKLAAREQVKQEMVVYALADKLDCKISRSEYNDELNKMLKNAGYTKKSYKKASGQSIEDYADDNNLYVGVLYDKVMDKVMKTAKAD